MLFWKGIYSAVPARSAWKEGVAVALPSPAQPNPLETEPIHRLIPRYAVPTAMTLMVNCLYNLVDQIFVGQGVGITATAAVNVAFPMVILVNALSLMLGDGCAANISLNLGRRNQAEADATVSHTVTLLLVSGVVLGLACGLLAPQIAVLFGATDTALAEAADYLRVLAWGLPFQLLCPALTAVIRADGRPRYALRCMVLGTVINLVLDPIFIFPLQMGVVGAGIATVLGQMVAGSLFLWDLRRFRTVHVRRSALRPTWALTGRILALGFPSFLTQILTALVQIVLNNLMRRCGAATVYGGDMALSVYGMMMKVYQISHAMFVGVSSAVSPINGYNFGARRYDRVLQTYRLAAAIALTISAVWFVVFQLFPRPIAGLFISGDPLYQDCAQHCFRLYMAAFFLYGLHLATASFFQGIGRPLPSMAIPLVRQGLLLIPLALLLSVRLGLDGALLAAPIADILTFALSLSLALREFHAWRAKGWLPAKKQR